MTLIQKTFGIVTSLIILSIIITLVKKGKLREEYSWMWLFTAFMMIIVVLRYDILVFITKLIGAVTPTTTLFIFGIVFLIFLSLHFAIKVSKLTFEVKNLAQKLSILEAESDHGKPGTIKWEKETK